MKKIITIIITISLTSFLSGVLTGYIYTNKTTETIIPKQTINTRQISGEKIIVKPMATKGSTFILRTEAAGAGIAETEIDKTVIPEAANWLKRDKAIQFQIGLLYTQQQLEPVIDILFWKRWNSVSIGAGASMSRSTFAIKGGLQYLF